MHHHTLPKPNESRRHILILTLNLSKLKCPKDLGKVMLKSQVEDRGRQGSSVKYMAGGEGNPVAGNLDDPEKKWTTSLIFTSPVPVKCMRY